MDRPGRRLSGSCRPAAPSYAAGSAGGEQQMNRREFVKGLGGVTTVAAGAAGAQPAADVATTLKESWGAGPVEHLLPTVNDRRLLLKASFARPLDAVSLVVGRRRVDGQRT